MGDCANKATFGEDQLLEGRPAMVINGDMAMVISGDVAPELDGPTMLLLNTPDGCEVTRLSWGFMYNFSAADRLLATETGGTEGCSNGDVPGELRRDHRIVPKAVVLLLSVLCTIAGLGWEPKAGLLKIAGLADERTTALRGGCNCDGPLAEVLAPCKVVPCAQFRGSAIVIVCCRVDAWMQPR